MLLETDKCVYTLGENVTITLTNNGSERVDIGGYPAWQIFTYPREEPVYPAIFASLAWYLDPGENDTFVWNQYNEFNHSFVKPGAYVVRDTQGWGLSTHFEIIATEIIVPDDYPTIQEAINAASPGDTIFVRAGTYYENVVVNKSVSLIGEDKNDTIISGNGVGSVVSVYMNKASVAGFTIQNSGSEFPDSGVLLFNSHSNCINDNIIIDNKFGILLISSSHNNITDNIVSNNLHGIELYVNSKDNAVISNKVLDNNAGIYLHDADSNLVKNNVVNNNNFGIIVSSSESNSIEGNIVSQAEWAGIRVVDNSKGNFIFNNTARNNLDGLELTYANNNTLIRNTALHNGRYGIQIAYSNNNILIANEVSNNYYGIRLSEASSNNTIYHNNFINNKIQTYILFSPVNTVWDDGYPSGGNYWSDYTGLDLYSGPYQNETGSDGIGDTPYIIDDSNRDNYPLMKPWDAVSGNLQILEPANGSVIVGPVRITFVIENKGCDIEFLKGDPSDRIDLEIEYRSTAGKIYGWGVMLWSTSHSGLMLHSGEKYTQTVFYDPSKYKEAVPPDFIGDAPYGQTTLRLVHWKRINEGYGYGEFGVAEIEVILMRFSHVITATADIHPQTLNLRSRGKCITAYVELLEDYDVSDINVSSIMLNDTISAELKPVTVGDYDEDGVPDLMVKFGRTEVISYILANVNMKEKFITVTLTITGKLNDGTPFQGSDTIKMIIPMHRRLGRHIFPI